VAVAASRGEFLCFLDADDVMVRAASTTVSSRPPPRAGSSAEREGTRAGGAACGGSAGAGAAALGRHRRCAHLEGRGRDSSLHHVVSYPGSRAAVRVHRSARRKEIATDRWVAGAAHTGSTR